MDAAYDPSQWKDFCIAVAGAAAALAGLLVVAVSINVREILAGSHLPARAGSALIALTTPLVVSLLVVVPEQSTTAVGIELLVAGLSAGLLLTVLNLPTNLVAQRTTAMWFLGSAVPIVLLVVPLVLAGIGMIVESLGGLYWLPIAVLAALIGGLVQAWVLLVEILR